MYKQFLDTWTDMLRLEVYIIGSNSHFIREPLLFYWVRVEAKYGIKVVDREKYLNRIPSWSLFPFYSFSQGLSNNQSSKIEVFPVSLASSALFIVNRWNALPWHKWCYDITSRFFLEEDAVAEMASSPHAFLSGGFALKEKNEGTKPPVPPL